MKNEILIFSLEELSKVEGLSMRTKNVCEFNNLPDINSILTYYWDNNNFLKLRNCGQKSNNELIDICIKYENVNVKSEIKERLELYEEKDLTLEQIQILNKFISSKLQKLSRRCLNAIKLHLSRDISFKSINKILNYNDKEIRNIKNIGNNSINELKDFVDSVNDLLNSFFISEANTTVDLFKERSLINISIRSNILAIIIKNYDFSNGLQVFKTLKILIDNKVIFKELELKIFNSCFNFFKDLNKCSQRQNSWNHEIKNESTTIFKVYENLDNTFSFLKYLKIEVLNLYGLDLTCNYIAINEELVDIINHDESTNFNLIFINKILSILFFDSYILIGDEESIVFYYKKNYNSPHNWKNTYLVLKGYANSFDFAQFINDVDYRLAQSINKDYYLDFKAYLLNFQKESCGELIENISKIATYILLGEFGLIIDNDANIVFARNTKKQVLDYVYEILDEKNEALTVTNYII